MSLFNIDRESLDRSNPQPATHDEAYVTGHPIIDTPRPAHGTLSTQYISPGQQATNLSSLGQFVQTGIISGALSGSAEEAFSVPHGLGYAPYPTGILNGYSITGISGTDLAIPLPSFLNASLGGGAITFSEWGMMIADATNVYFYVLNADGGTGSFRVTYYLYKQMAQQTVQYE
jgi:hypothetical protein